MKISGQTPLLNGYSTFNQRIQAKRVQNCLFNGTALCLAFSRIDTEVLKSQFYSHEMHRSETCLNTLPGAFVNDQLCKRPINGNQTGF